jgi:hypothetical protein
MFLRYEDDLSNVFKEQQLNVGIGGGYKFNRFQNHKSLSGLYLTPWAGVSRFAKTDDIQLGEESFERKAMTIFRRCILEGHFNLYPIVKKLKACSPQHFNLSPKKP